MGRDKNHHHAMDDIINVKKDEHKLMGEIIGTGFMNGIKVTGIVCGDVSAPGIHCR
ncbi:MAG: hypothetical protein O2950_09280 [Proteobacteria bacterium]|nr:hypothetical protein [Pseudomonadota bacterium]MDA1352460.1 hypothetical protein [Pseudomonadota bacterium]